MNHLIFDGISVSILFNDLNDNYLRLKKNGKFTQRLEVYKNKIINADELNYCAEQSKKNISTLKTDAVFNPEKCILNNLIYLNINREFTETLRFNLTKKFKANISDILLAILGWTFSELNKSDCVCINTFNNGRDFQFDNLNILNVVGSLANKFPVIFDFNGINNLNDAVENAIIQIKKIPEKGKNFGLYKYSRTLDTQQEIFNKFNNREITFNYLSSIYEFGKIVGFEKFAAPKLNHKNILSDVILNIIANQYENKLLIIWRFDDNIISEKSIKQIINRFVYTFNILILENL